MTTQCSDYSDKLSVRLNSTESLANLCQIADYARDYFALLRTSLGQRKSKTVDKRVDSKLVDTFLSLSFMRSKRKPIKL